MSFSATEVNLAKTFVDRLPEEVLTHLDDTSWAIRQSDDTSWILVIDCLILTAFTALDEQRLMVFETLSKLVEAPVQGGVYFCKSRGAKGCQIACESKLGCKIREIKASI